VQQHFSKLFQKMPASTPLYLNKSDVDLDWWTIY
jgi:hypothetical protein